MAYSFDMPPGIDPNDDGTHSLPAYLAQAMQYYGTPNSSPLPTSYSYPLNNQQGQSMFGGGAPLVSPVSQAMNPAPTDTPVSQAMSPQPDQSPVSQAMAPPQLSPIQQLFQRQMTDPNLSTDNGLIAAGSALLGGKNLQQGMADAGQAFNDSYDKTINKQFDLNTPKVTPIADGAFSMVQLPGQAPSVIPSNQVQQFLYGKAQIQGQIAMNKVTQQANLAAQRDQAKDDRANAKEYGAKLVQTQTALDANQRALDVAHQQADQGWTPQLAGAFPGIAQAVGSDAARGNLVLQRAHIDAALVQDAVKKGAITDQQAGFLNSDIPSATADRKTVIIPFLEQQQEILQKVHDFQQGQYSKSNPTPPQGFATAGTSNVPGGANQSTGSGSYQPQAVSDKASYDALPSGAVFKAPDGSIRRKP